MSADDRPPRSAMHRFVRHPSLPLVVLTVAAVVTLVGTFVPWLRSGSTSRTSYELLGALARLDFAPDGVVSVLVRGWPVVPLLVTAAVVAAWWRWTWVSVAAAAAAALYAGGVGLTMVIGAHRTGIDVEPGPWVCLLGATVLLVAAAWLALSATTRAARAPVSAPQADPS